MPATCPAQNQSLLNQALIVLVEQGGLGFLNLGEFMIQADKLEQLQEMKKRGQGDRNPPVPFSLLLEHDSAWVVPGSRTALSAYIEIGYLGEQGGQRPGIIHSHHIIYFHKPWWGMPGTVQAGMQRY